mgnify:CR=1 FL=1
MGDEPFYKTSDDEWRDKPSCHFSLGAGGSTSSPFNHLMLMYSGYMQLKNASSTLFGMDVTELVCPAGFDEAKFERGGLIYQLWVLYNRKLAMGRGRTIGLVAKATGERSDVHVEFIVSPAVYDCRSIMLTVASEDTEYLHLVEGVLSSKVFLEYVPDAETVESDLNKFIAMFKTGSRKAPFVIEDEVHDTKHAISFTYDYSMSRGLLNNLSDWFAAYVNDKPSVFYFPVTTDSDRACIDICKDVDEWLDMDLDSGLLILSGTTSESMLIMEVNFTDRRITFTGDYKTDTLKLRADALSYGVAKL